MNFKLRILTPTKEVFNNDIDSLIVPSENGSLGILANHRAIVSSLKKGKIKIKSQNINKEFLLEERGILKFNKNEAVILTDNIKDL